MDNFTFIVFTIVVKDKHILKIHHLILWSKFLENAPINPFKHYLSQLSVLSTTYNSQLTLRQVYM